MAPDGKQPGITAFRLDRVLEAHAVKTEFLSEVMARPELSELRLLTPYLRLDDADTHGNLFHVVADGVQTPLVFEKRGAKYELNRDSEKAFVKDTAFQGLYLKALKTSEAVEKRFAALNGAVDEMPESFVVDFFASFPGFGGSVADEAVKAVTLSKKYMALAKFAAVLPTAQSLRDVEKLRHSHFDPVLLGVEHEAARIRSASRDKQVHGKNWSRDEVHFEVLGPILAIGTASQEYANLLSNFLNDVFSATGSADFNARVNVLGVYAYYTANVDAPALDGIDYSKWRDPAVLDALKRIHYCKYVQAELMRTFPAGNPSIKRFEDFTDSVDLGTLVSLDHKPSARPRPTSLTPLEQEFANQFDDAFDKLKKMGGIRYEKLERLRAKLLVPDSTGNSVSSVELNAVAGKPRMEQLAYVQRRVRYYVDAVLIKSDYWMDVSLKLKAKAIWQRLTQ